METKRKTFRNVTPEELLGPLNDVESKYAPVKLYISGSMGIPLPRPRVSIVGSRKASETGLDVASEIAGKLSRKNVVIVSGLAEGIDSAAHKGTIEAGGQTIAVLGTSLDKVYPRKNTLLQREIMSNHLAVSQFPIGHPVERANFVLRNRTMALISNASIIVEAGESSGSLHHGLEALRLSRQLFIWKSVLDNVSLKWPRELVKHGALKLDDVEQVMDVLSSSERILSTIV